MCSVDISILFSEEKKKRKQRNPTNQHICSLVQGSQGAASFLQVKANTFLRSAFKYQEEVGARLVIWTVFHVLSVYLRSPYFCFTDKIFQKIREVLGILKI